jgi:hypothetical protein
MHSLPGALRVSQVLDVSLDTCHALKWTPADLRARTLSRSPYGLWVVKTVAICFAMSGIATLISGLY